MTNVVASISARAGLAIIACSAAAPAASAQLRPDQVLVVYDSRAADSLQMAEYYAGSAKVPGGVGGQPGKRPQVKVFDLGSSGAPANTTGDISYAQFVNQVRNPIRAWLTANDPTGNVRSIALCPRIPHRIYQASPIYAGDNPNLTASSFNAGTFTSCSVDSELALLWQDLGGDTSVAAGTKSTGMILNPYWRATTPITGFITTNRATAKTFTAPTTSPATSAGMVWSASVLAQQIAATPTQLAPGDIYLVCRLDGKTLAHAKAMVDRAQNIVMNVDAAAFVMDESGASPTTDAATNAEFDNQGYNLIWGGDDYEQTRDALIADGRFVASKVRYDASGGANSFIVGPNINYGGQGLIVSDPLLLLSSYGANASWPAPGEQPETGTNVRTTYATSFNLAPGCVFTSYESFNGRALWDITGHPAFPQQQVIDFLAAGGTFAIGTAWEPFAMTVPDDLPIVRTFHLGSLSWAEAAYSSTPVLSYQSIVYGDPLARVTRTSEDLTADGVITIDDLYGWHAASASRQDLNRSGTVTDADRRFVEDAVRASRDTDMRGGQR